MSVQPSNKRVLSRPPRIRLDSIKNPQPRPLPRQVRQSAAKVVPQCSNTECSNSDVVEDDGKLICRSCGFVLSEVQITQELTFGEAANGAAVVQGVYVGANDDSARNPALGASKIAGGMDSRQVTERNGLHHINNFVAALRLNNTHKERAMQIYRLAMSINFIQGRVTRQVAAVCLYIACRKDSESKLMLIDFSDLLEMNVFKLGQIYNTLVTELGLRTEKFGLYDMNPENLIQRFAQDLEFGKDEHRIANEAVQILKRLKRDWILMGRRPAGVCGAAIILAARMNNYRRTVREVVYTAKVADITIHKRLDEFRYTESSKLTVAEFRHHGLNLEKDHDPPAFYGQFEPKKKRRKRKQDGAAEGVSDGESRRGDSVVPTSENPTTTDAPAANSSKKAQADAQAMPPPPIPIDPALLEDISDQHLLALAEAQTGTAEDEPIDDGISNITGRKRRPGRPQGSRNKPLPVLQDTALDEEAEIEQEVDAIIQDPQSIAHAAEAHQLSVQTLQTPPASQLHTSQARDRPVSSFSEPAAVTEIDKRAVPDTVEILASEFDNDPEVEHCLLSPAEIAIKERIWVHENGDYLRNQQARKIKQQLAEAAGTARVAKKRIRHRGRMGDMSKYRTIGEDGQSSGPQTPAEATKAMMKRRAYSTKINYGRVDHLFQSPSSRSASSASRSQSVATSMRDGSNTPTPTPSAPHKVVEMVEKRSPVLSPPPPPPVQKPQDPIVIEDNGDDDDDDSDDEGNEEDYYQDEEEIGAAPAEEEYDSRNEEE